MAWVGHALGGFAEYAADQVTHGQPRPTLTDYLESARFWFESFQNWQSEFLAIALDGVAGGVPATAMVAGVEARARAARRDRPLSGSARHAAGPTQTSTPWSAATCATWRSRRRHSRRCSATSGAAAAILALDDPLTELVGPDGALPRISGHRSGVDAGDPRGPRDRRIADRRAGDRATASAAPTSSGGVRFGGTSSAGPKSCGSSRDPRLRRSRAWQHYRGDLQMHSEWSDGTPTVEEIADACLAARLSIRGGHRSFVRPEDRRRHVDGRGGRAARAIDASTSAAAARSACCRASRRTSTRRGSLDLTDERPAHVRRRPRRAAFAAAQERGSDRRSSSRRRASGVRILAHPRGRMTGSRAGVVADWDAVFAAAARRGVAIEIDGDPARQDLDHTLARAGARGGLPLRARQRRAYDDAARLRRDRHRARATGRHSRERIVNCWPLERLLGWLSRPSSESGR